MKKPCDRVSVPGPWNREERRYISVLREMVAYAERSIADRDASGRPADYDRERVNALEWALAEVEKSRVALVAARKAE